MGKKSGGGTNVQVDPNVGKAQLKMADIAEREQQMYEKELLPWVFDATREANQMQRQIMERDNENADFWQNYAKDEADKWNERADYYYDRHKNVYEPVETSMMADVDRYNEGAEAERQAQLAAGDSAAAYEQQRRAQEMQLQQYGINPTAGAYVMQNRAQDLQHAALQASATTAARQAANELGWNKKAQMVAIGQPYINASLGAASQGTGTATGVGGLAQNSLAGAGQAAQAILGNVQGAGQTASQFYGNLGNRWGQIGNLGMQVSNFNLQQAQGNAQIAAQNRATSMSGLGSLVGAGATVGAAVII